MSGSGIGIPGMIFLLIMLVLIIVALRHLIAKFFKRNRH